MTGRLRVGFIGVGRIADMHYEGYRDNPRASLDAVCDVDPSLARRRAAEWAPARPTTTTGSAAGRPGHRRGGDHHAAPPARRDEHRSPRRGQARLRAEAHGHERHRGRRRTGRRRPLGSGLFRVIENYRFTPLFARAKEMLDAGEIGEPLSLRLKSLTGNLEYGWDVPPNAQDWRSDSARSGEGSVNFDHGQHIWSIARFLMGDVERDFRLCREGARPGRITSCSRALSSTTPPWPAGSTAAATGSAPGSRSTPTTWSSGRSTTPSTCRPR